jgi:hypothetical protein
VRKCTADLTCSAWGNQNSINSKMMGVMLSFSVCSRSQKTQRSVVHTKHSKWKNVRYDSRRWRRWSPEVTNVSTNCAKMTTVNARYNARKTEGKGNWLAIRTRVA